MTQNEWKILLAGAAIGAILSLIATIIYSVIQHTIKFWKVKSHLKTHYNGIYKSRTKSEHENQLNYIKILYRNANILDIEFDTKYNGVAKGYIIVNSVTLKDGKIYYWHIEEEHSDKSGIYDVILLENGLIHAKLSYIKPKTRNTIIEQFIWERE